MSREVWFISDTHFNHAKIIEYCNRPFDTADEMNEALIENWNSVVKVGDLVYHLGDVFIGNAPEFNKIWPKLNGSKRLILGNHDDGKYLSNGGYFQKVQMWRMWNDRPLIFSHAPLMINEHLPRRLYNEGGEFIGMNVHGHIHDADNPSEYHMNISVERINYTPINLEDI